MAQRDAAPDAHPWRRAAVLGLMLAVSAAVPAAGVPGPDAAIARLGHDAAGLRDAVRSLRARLAGGLAVDAVRVAPEGARSYVAAARLTFDEVLGESRRADAVQALAQRMQRAGLVALIVRRGSDVATWAPPWGPRERMRGVPVAVLGVAAAAALARFRGAEWKSVVADDHRRHYAVAARHELDGALEIRWAPWHPVTPDRGPAGAALGARYGVGPLEDGTARWTPVQRGLVALALARLAPAELRAIRGLPLRREHVSSLDLEDKAGLYRVEDGRRWVELYDRAFEEEGVAFAGRPEAPVPYAVRVILHEIGHAIAMVSGVEDVAAFREAAAGLNALTQRYNALGKRVSPTQARELRSVRRTLTEIRDALPDLQRDVQQAIHRSRVLEAYAEATGGLGPTEYGRTSVAEAFAEAFALYRVDRPALERVEPAAVSFFDAGRHLATRRAPDPRTAEE